MLPDSRKGKGRLNMAYLAIGGADRFKYDTDKVFKIGFIEKRVSGSNLVPIIDAIKHYEAVLGMGGNEQQKALCSILSRANKWFTIKEAKVKIKKGVRTGTKTLSLRTRVVSALMKEAMAALNVFQPGLNTAMVSYMKNKNKGAKPTGSLSGGMPTSGTPISCSARPLLSPARLSTITCSRTKIAI
jgi:hypothetical protein